jgi:hypothetical protein
MQVQSISNSMPSFNMQTSGYFAYFAEANAIVHEVYTTALPVIKSCTSIYYFGLGMNELFWKCSLQQATDRPKTSYGLKSRGIAYIGTGICDSYVALHSLAIFNLNSAISKISFIGNICFLYANLATLAENILFFQKAQSDDIASGQSRERMKSAFLGIISSLGYILTSALTLFGASTAVIILISIFAANAGFLKTILDYSNASC